MKKVSIIILVAAAFGLISCASSKDALAVPESAPETTKEQVAVNKEFEKVYTSHKKNLVLDGAKSHTVVYGDQLTSIAKQYYGEDNGYYFPLIMLASKDVVLDPDMILPGMVLTVPSFDANINDKDVAVSLKPYFLDIAEVYKKKNTATAPTTRENLQLIAEQLGSKTVAKTEKSGQQ